MRPAARARSRSRSQQASGESSVRSEASLPARTILVAAGTQPNTVLAREHPAHFALDGRYFRLLDEDGHAVDAGQGPREAGAPVPC